MAAKPRQLTNDPTADWFPRWSPDGASMAFYSFRSGNREIWVRPVERGVAQQLTQGDAESVFPAWSPDGREIAFYSPRAGTDDIYAVSVDGGEPRQVISAAGDEEFPVYSPDGNWIFLLFKERRVILFGARSCRRRRAGASCRHDRVLAVLTRRTPCLFP